MIAFAKKSKDTKTTATPAWHAGFLRLLPSIRTHVWLAFRKLDGDAREEAIQECLANAAVAYARLAERGKEDIAYANPLATFAVKQFHDGRRVGRRLNIRDVSSEHCQRRKDVRFTRLDHFDSGSGEWKELVVEDRRATPADVAATKIDFQEWLRTLPKRDRRVAMRLATGETTGGVAKLFAITSARVSQLRRELYEGWQAFQGESTLAVA